MPPPNTGLERTAQSADKIVAIWKLRIGSTAFPIYMAPPLKLRPLGDTV